MPVGPFRPVLPGVAQPRQFLDLLAEGLTNAANDKQQVVPMVEEIRRQMGRLPRELSADSGYCSEDNLEALDDITPEVHRFCSIDFGS